MCDPNAVRKERKESWITSPKIFVKQPSSSKKGPWKIIRARMKGKRHTAY